MKINKSNFFLVLISTFSLSIATIYNGCSPLEAYGPEDNGSLLPSGPTEDQIAEDDTENDNDLRMPGAITTVTPLGILSGWVADMDDLNRVITVNFYSEDSLIGTVVAEEEGSSGEHLYSFELPGDLRDGNPQLINAYGVDKDGNEIELQGSPFPMIAYSLSQESIDFFNDNIQGTLVACEGCHTFNSAEEVFSRLVTPPPHLGGTNNSNALYTYSTGGLGHAGGVACNAACADNLQTWHDLSF